MNYKGEKRCNSNPINKTYVFLTVEEFPTENSLKVTLIGYSSSKLATNVHTGVESRAATHVCALLVMLPQVVCKYFEYVYQNTLTFSNYIMVEPRVVVLCTHLCCLLCSPSP